MILSRRWNRVGLVVLVLAMLATILPFVFTFLNSIKYFKDIVSGSLLFQPTLVNYQRLFVSQQSAFLVNTGNSAVVAVVSTILVVSIAALGGYSLNRFGWPRRFTAILAGWILLFHMIPGVTMVGPGRDLNYLGPGCWLGLFPDSPS